jgi:acyl carrier protein
MSRGQSNPIADEVLTLVMSTAQSILGKHAWPSDNFFLLGGDSMGAVEMMYTLEVHFDAEFDPASIIKAEDIAALAMSLYNQLQES